jgi:D-glycero-D-manno-heptose 1,7-bisphosphate phosphatase
VALSGLQPEAAEERDKVVTRAVFLDRDGVLSANVERDGRPVAPRSLDDFRILPGVEDATKRLKELGFVLVVATNQPDIRTGHLAKATLEAMHSELRRRLPLDDIKVCAHVDADACHCRKPRPGMILDAARERGIDLKQSIMVGDRWRDIEAGQAAGCLTILVDCGDTQEKPSTPDRKVRSLAEAVAYIVEREHIEGMTP